MDKEIEEKYLVAEFGLMWHPSGKITIHQVWSDGTESDRIQDCPRSLGIIRDYTIGL